MSKVAAVTAVVIGKAARHDFPSGWVGLLPHLGALLSSTPPDAVPHRRALHLLSIVLKSLAAKRIGPATLRFPLSATVG